MNKDEVMSQLEALGSEKVREMHARHGACENQFGVKMGDLRTLAKSIKLNHSLALELWQTGNLDAMLLATLLMRPKEFSLEELDAMVAALTSSLLADWLGTHVIKLHPQKEQLRQRWMQSDQPMTQRAGWSLTTERIIKSPQGLDLAALLDRIEAELGSAPALAQWTMNYSLAEIGIHFPEHRERALAIGEKLGVFRDYPTPKGCTSPYAPLWIAVIVNRQG
ncbi:DNA alkylation repair protein [Armatimonas sp.]|uniref:DNA alkylation repair protein n=1 Tax=Armatimonas sp. TaxID=1872638 RepID=UPI0037529767